MRRIFDSSPVQLTAELPGHGKRIQERQVAPIGPGQHQQEAMASAEAADAAVPGRRDFYDARNGLHDLLLPRPVRHKPEVLVWPDGPDGHRRYMVWFNMEWNQLARLCQSDVLIGLMNRREWLPSSRPLWSLRCVGPRCGVTRGSCASGRPIFGTRRFHRIWPWRNSRVVRVRFLQFFRLPFHSPLLLPFPLVECKAEKTSWICG